MVSTVNPMGPLTMFLKKISKVCDVFVCVNLGQIGNTRDRFLPPRLPPLFAAVFARNQSKPGGAGGNLHNITLTGILHFSRYFTYMQISNSSLFNKSIRRSWKGEVRSAAGWRLKSQGFKAKAIRILLLESPCSAVTKFRPHNGPWFMDICIMHSGMYQGRASCIDMDFILELSASLRNHRHIYRYQEKMTYRTPLLFVSLDC